MLVVALTLYSGFALYSEANATPFLDKNMVGDHNDSNPNNRTNHRKNNQTNNEINNQLNNQTNNQLNNTNMQNPDSADFPGPPRRTGPNSTDNPRNIDNRYHNSDTNFKRTATANNDRGMDYGWIGLFGLAGLLGLLRGGRKS
jgi:hypothetical protein